MPSAIHDYNECLRFSTESVRQLAYEMRSSDCDRWTLLSQDNSKLLDALCAYTVIAKGYIEFQLEPDEIKVPLRDYKASWKTFLKDLPDAIRRELQYGQTLDTLEQLCEHAEKYLSSGNASDLDLLKSSYSAFIDHLSELGQILRISLTGPIPSADIQPPRIGDTKDCKRFLFELAQQLIKDKEVEAVTNLAEAAEYMRECKAKDKYFEFCTYAQDIQKRVQRNTFYAYIRQGKPSKSATRSNNQVDAKRRFNRKTTHLLKS